MRTEVLWIGLILGGAGLPWPRTENRRRHRPGNAGEAKASPEEKAIRPADDAFVREYNKGDTKALAARFTEDAEVIEADGDALPGACA